MDCHALNETELLKYGMLEKIDETEWFFQRLSLENAPDKIDELSVYTDIKKH